MTSSNQIVANAISARNATSAEGVFSSFVDAHAGMWKNIKGFNLNAAWGKFQAFKKAIEAMGSEVKADFASELRDFEAIYKKVKPFEGKMSKAGFWATPEFRELSNLAHKYNKPLPKSVSEWVASAQTTEPKKKVVKTKVDDDDFLD